MADILSLGKARKAKARVDKEQQATENRVKFGRTKADKQRDAAAKALRDKLIEGHKRED